MTRRRLIERLTTAGRMVAAVATVAGVIWIASANFAALRADVASHEEAIVDHENRLRIVEQRLERIDVNVRWIREAMEGQ